MNKNIYVVTNPELVWDCVVGIYEAESEEAVYKHLAKEQERTLEDMQEEYIVHYKVLKTI